MGFRLLRFSGRRQIVPRRSSLWHRGWFSFLWLLMACLVLFHAHRCACDMNVCIALCIMSIVFFTALCIYFLQVATSKKKNPAAVELGRKGGLRSRANLSIDQRNMLG